MTEFRKDLNKVLKEPEIAKIVDRYNKGYMVLYEAIEQISERKKLERYAFDEARNNAFVMADQTESQLWKKIINTSTDHLKDFVKGIEARL